MTEVVIVIAAVIVAMFVCYPASRVVRKILVSLAQEKELKTKIEQQARLQKYREDIAKLDLVNVDDLLDLVDQIQRS